MIDELPCMKKPKTPEEIAEAEALYDALVETAFGHIQTGD